MADERGAADVISFRDPAGNRVEAFHGGRIANESFRPTRHNRGLPYREARRGHAGLMVPDIDAALKSTAGLRITDLVGPPVSLYFMHVNTRHHSPHYCSGIAQPHAP